MNLVASFIYYVYNLIIVQLKSKMHHFPGQYLDTV